MPKLYRKKPIIIEARQSPTDGTPAEAHAIYQWVEKNTLGSFEPLAIIEGREPWPESGITIDPRDGRMVIATLEGGHWVTPGDFIIRGVQGEFYPCKSGIFAATYEPAETVPARHETPDLAELRRLLAGASPLPWQWEPPSGRNWPQGDESLVTTSGDPVLYGWGYDDASGIDGTDADRALIAAERDALAAKVERVRALHRAFGIYDECDCDDPDPATHLDVDDVGLTCNLMYRVCAECCRDDVYQTEDCANYHDHRLDEDYHCPTIRALDEEPQP